MSAWSRVTKFDPRGASLADRHYSRRKVGSPQFMPPGQTIILLTNDESAVFGWWRPHPRSEMWMGLVIAAFHLAAPLGFWLILQ